MWEDPIEMFADQANSLSSEEKQPSSQSLSLMEEKALLSKIDRRVIPMLFMIYLAAFLDR